MNETNAPWYPVPDTCDCSLFSTCWMLDPNYRFFLFLFLPFVGTMTQWTLNGEWWTVSRCLSVRFLIYSFCSLSTCWHCENIPVFISQCVIGLSVSLFFFHRPVPNCARGLSILFFGMLSLCYLFPFRRQLSALKLHVPWSEYFIGDFVHIANFRLQ